MNIQFYHHHLAGGKHADILIGSTQTIGNNHRCALGIAFQSTTKPLSVVRRKNGSIKPEQRHLPTVGMSGEDKVGIRYSDILSIVGRMRQQNHKVVGRKGERIRISAPSRFSVSTRCSIK